MAFSDWLSVGTFIASIGLIGWLRHQARGLMQMADDWRGRPQRVGPGGIEIEPARPAVMERIAALKSEVRDVKKELYRNGGSSLRDVVDRIDKRLQVVEQHTREAVAVPERPKVEAGGLGFQAEIAA